MKSRSSIFDKNVGSIGNMIASQGPDNVIYFRSKNPNPYNPNTTEQQAQRSKFAHIVAVVTAALGFVRQWFTPLKNNQSAYNSAVSAAGTSAVSETTLTFLQFVRNHITWVKGVLGNVTGITIANFALDSGTIYKVNVTSPNATLYGEPQADYKLYTAAISTSTGEIISDSNEEIATTDDIELDVPLGTGVQFIGWLYNIENGKWSNQIKLGYKAAGGTTVV